MNNWKVFEVNEDWILARSTAEAKDFFQKKVAGLDQEDIYCREVTDKEMDELKFFLDDNQTEHISFKEQLEEVLKHNPEKPEVFAVSEW